MKQKWLSWLKTSQLILLLIILFSCSKKNKYPKMKTGYYQLIEVNSYTNGSIETINRIVLGPEILDETNFVVSFFITKMVINMGIISSLIVVQVVIQ